jgi:SAM-dependent methyltransferase
VTTFLEAGAGYAEQLSRGLKLTGEDATYFARQRVRRTNHIAAADGVRPGVVLDFGCGSGAGFASLRETFADARIVAFEPDHALRTSAADAAASAGVEILNGETLELRGVADIVYCNGVFHHIPLTERMAAMRRLRDALRPGGLACIWENSPYNPGTRLIMSRIPFDRDARLLPPRGLRALQQSCGLLHVTTEYHFVFPRALAFLRRSEPLLRSLPIGGQYLVVGRTPS